jgi:hypothetical protein
MNMIKYLLRSEIDDAKWNMAVTASSNPLIYACTFYLDIVCPNWVGLVLDNYQLVMPLPLHKKQNTAVVKMPTFAKQLGIFGSLPITEEVILSFVKQIPFEIESLSFNPQNPISKAPAGFNHVVKKNYELNINKEDSVILRDLSKNRKRDYKKPVKNDLKFVTNVSQNLFIKFCILSESIKIKSKYFLEQLFSINHKLNFGSLVGVTNDANQLIAVAFFLNFLGKIIYLFGATNQQAIQKRAMTFLFIQKIINNSSDSTILDFEGGNYPGTEQFYRSFGSTNIPYYVLSSQQSIC